MASKFFKQWDSLYSKEWFCLNEPPIAISWHILLPFLPHSCLHTKWMSIILMGKFRLMAGKLWSQQLNIHLSLQRICFFAISWNELYIKFVLHQDFIHLNYVILYLFIYFSPSIISHPHFPYRFHSKPHFCLSEGAHRPGHYGSSCSKHNSPHSKGRCLNRRGDWSCLRWWERNDAMFLSELANNLHICGYIIFTNTAKVLSE